MPSAAAQIIIWDKDNNILLNYKIYLRKFQVLKKRGRVVLVVLSRIQPNGFTNFAPPAICANGWPSLTLVFLIMP